MTNVNKTTQRTAIRKKLRAIAEETLRRQGWKVERVAGAGTSVRKITKAGDSKTIAIRTTQDTWIAFPRTPDDKRWKTLSDVDAVVASSVDDPSNPLYAQVHILDGDDMRKRFDRAYKARLAAGHTIPVGRGVWLSLYKDEGNDPIQLVGAGAGNVYPCIERVPLNGGSAGAAIAPDGAPADGPLTIAEAKRRLAQTLGVDPSSIKITVEA